jgi:PAS domain S-box-containing protein
MSLEVVTTNAPRANLRSPWPPLATSISVAVAFFLAAHLSLALLDKADGVAVFWPAAGVATGVLVAFGSAMRWPVITGVVAATFAANLLGDRNLAGTTVFAVANASGPLIVAGLIQRFHGAPFELDQLRRVIGLFVATILAAFASGVIGAFGFLHFHTSTSSALTIWRHWVVSESLGTITVAPLVIGLASFLRHAPPRREVAEGTLALITVATLCLLLVFAPNEPWTIELAIAALAPLFVWIAARVRPAFMAVATFMCTITVVWTTIFSVGLFGDPRFPIEERILSAQATILATSFGALVLAALFSERRMHEHAILEREQRLEGALRAGRVITFDWDLRASQISLSPNAREILGLGARTSLGDAEWVERIHPDDRPSIAARLHLADRDDRSHAMTFRFQRPDGREVWLEQVTVTHTDATGKPARINGLMTDITERKLFEEEISRAWKSAALADQAKSSFLSAASHDLRQPLQTLKLLAATLDPHLGDGEGRSLLRGMERSLETMSGILSSLLDVNRLETGNLRPSKSDFAINEVFDVLAADFRDFAAEKRLRWRMVRSGLLVRSDRNMLEAMLRNLLSNAIRYTDRGSILLGCRRSGDKIRIEVWDSGIGISQSQLHLIFQEYYQSADGAERGGLGLGLAIVRRIGEVLKHRIDVRSTPGKGTVFWIEVPRGSAGSPAPESLRPPAQQEGGLPDVIFVVEDETSVRTSLSRLLREKGIRAIAVATAEDALAQVQEVRIRPDLLICDYNLRGSANGVDTINALREALEWNIPAIVMTGDIRSKVVDSITAPGVAVLIKPVTAKDLLQQISRLHQEAIPGDPMRAAER